MERNTAIRTLHETKLKVRLVFFDIVHELPYEGPCRFGKGPELEREFDEMINQEAYKGIQMGIKFNLPENVEMLEPRRYVNHTENWRISEEEMEKLCVGSEDTDVYLVSTTGYFCRQRLRSNDQHLGHAGQRDRNVFAAYLGSVPETAASAARPESTGQYTRSLRIPFRTRLFPA